MGSLLELPHRPGIAFQQGCQTAPGAGGQAITAVLTKTGGTCLAASLALAGLLLVLSTAPSQAETTAVPPRPPAGATQPPGCTTTQPGSEVTRKPPGSGEMSTSATGMMTDPGRHTLPCPAPKPK